MVEYVDGVFGESILYVKYIGLKFDYLILDQCLILRSSITGVTYIYICCHQVPYLHDQFQIWCIYHDLMNIYLHGCSCKDLKMGVSLSIFIFVVSLSIFSFCLFCILATIMNVELVAQFSNMHISV